MSARTETVPALHPKPTKSPQSLCGQCQWRGGCDWLTVTPLSPSLHHSSRRRRPSALIPLVPESAALIIFCDSVLWFGFRVSGAKIGLATGLCCFLNARAFICSLLSLRVAINARHFRQLLGFCLQFDFTNEQTVSRVTTVFYYTFSPVHFSTLYISDAVYILYIFSSISSSSA